MSLSDYEARILKMVQDSLDKPRHEHSWAYQETQSLSYLYRECETCHVSETVATYG